MTRTITLECDDLDYDLIMTSIAAYQVTHHVKDEGTLLPEGEGNLAGRVVAELLRDLDEYLLSHKEAEAFRQTGAMPAVPDRTEWEPTTRPCPRCKDQSATVMLRESASSDYADEYYRCHGCGHQWNIDGHDS